MTPWLELWMYPLGDVGVLDVGEDVALHVGASGVSQFAACAWDVDVLPAAGITLTGVRHKPLVTGSNDVSIYIRTGTAVGNASSSSGWTLLQTTTESFTATVIHTITLASPVALPQGVTGFYVMQTAVGTKPFSGVAGVPATYSAAQAEITTYSVNDISFGATYANYRADVGIEYTVREPLTITTPAPVSTALAALAALATAWSPNGLTYAFGVTEAGGLALEADGAWRLWLSDTMAALLGISTPEQAVASGVPVTSDQTALAFHAPIGIGYSNLREVEEVALREYSHGRTSAYLSRHGRGVDVTLHVDVDQVDDVLEGPLGTHGLTRLYPTDATAADAYDRDHLEGYLDVYPVESKAFERPRWGNVQLDVECVLLDEAPAVVTGRKFAELAAALPFGFGFVYVAQVDGIPILFIEREYDAAAPSGYTLAASLVVDQSARLGSLVDREETGVGQGFSATLRLLDTAAVRGVFRSPGAVSWLTSDLSASATTIPVQTRAPFATLSPKIVYIGTEAIPFTSTSAAASALTGATRGSYGPGREHAAGTPVSDRPLLWPDRRIRLWAVAVDPTGRIVTSDGGLLTDAALAWSGHVGDTGAPSPRRVGAEWELVCEPLDRRLKAALGAAVTGKARWALDADPRILVDHALTITIKVEARGTGGGTIDQVGMQPFVAYYGTPVSLSRQMALVKEAWDAQHSSSYLGVMTWQPEADPSDPLRRIWRAWIQARIDPAWDVMFFTSIVLGVQASWTAAPGGLTSVTRPALPNTPTSLWGNAPTGLMTSARVTETTLEVAVERGDPSDLPSTGWVEIEGKNTGTRVLRYTSLTVGEDGIVRVQLAPGYTPDLASVAADAAAGEVEDLSARFTWGTAGTPATVMRTLLESSGRGDNGAYDTLAKGQGCDLADVDEESFDVALDGLLSVVGLDLAIDSRTSFAALFGGLLTLSERAIVARPNAAGDAMDLAAIRVSVPGVVSRHDTVTIRDRHLVYGAGGQLAVRPLMGRPAPRVVEIEVRTSSRGDALNIVETDDTRARGPTWNKTVYGADRSALVGPAGAWSLSLFRQLNVQALEIDVVPWLDVAEGDEVQLELSDVQLWQYSTGTPGYTGPAVVIGRQVKPDTKVQTLTVLADGIQATTVLSPSAPILDYTGSSTAPTAITVPREYYPVFKRYLNERDPDPLYLRLYAPGADNRRLRLDIDGVTDDGTSCVLNVSADVGTYDLDTVIYSEGFEADEGDWIQTLEDSEPTGGITRGTGATPTGGTGPTAAYAGSYYMFFESTGPALDDYEITLGPAVSLQGTGQARLTFARHLYGANVGTLSFEVSSDHGETWVSVWSESGNQGNSWAVQTVDLAAYLGEILRIRIVCTMPSSGVTGQSDMAWDAIAITVIRHHVTNPSDLTEQSQTQLAHLHVDTDAVWT